MRAHKLQPEHCMPQSGQLAAGGAARLALAAACTAAGRRVVKRCHRRHTPRRRAVCDTAWLPGQQDERLFASVEDYQQHLRREGALPQGFRIGSTSLTFDPAESQMVTEARMNLALIVLDEPTDQYALCFTSNAFPGCPVRVGRRRLAAGAPLQAVVVNNKVSNVCPSGDGEAASEEICNTLAQALALPGGAASVLPSSTGVIGWRLPVAEMKAALPAAVAALQAESAVPAAEAIMTTDRYPKVCSVALPCGARIVGFAKGAGMIEPRMATMLCYLLTDASLPCERPALQEMLRRAVSRSFNSVSVDGDESTSDTVALLASGRVPCPELQDFEAALTALCRDLAQQLVRNGEGTQHVMRVAIRGASSRESALSVGRGVVNGPLFKCAVAGNDPNVGRLVGKVGQVLGFLGEGAAAEGATFKIAGRTIFAGGQFTIDDQQEAELSQHLKSAEVPEELPYPPHFRVVDVEVELAGGDGEAVVLGSDLTEGYVRCNADYRS